MTKASAEEMANFIINALKDYFGERVDNFSIVRAEDEPPGHRSFGVIFIAYDYFPILLGYHAGNFGCTILFGTYGADLRNSQEWWEKSDVDIFLKELEKELELRIPEKFLRAKGWL